MRLKLLLAVLVAGLLGSLPVTTTVSAASFTYDLSAIARVGVHEIGTVRTDPAQLSDPRDASASPLVGDSGASTTPFALVVATNSASWLDEAATAKVPEGWGSGAATNKGVGSRWTDPANPGNGIRIDQGSPANSQISQQVDHVVVRHNGQVIGRNGQAISGSLKENAIEAHIPLSEWLTWTDWFAP